MDNAWQYQTALAESFLNNHYTIKNFIYIQSGNKRH